MQYPQKDTQIISLCSYFSTFDIIFSAWLEAVVQNISEMYMSCNCLSVKCPKMFCRRQLLLTVATRVSHLGSGAHTIQLVNFCMFCYSYCCTWVKILFVHSPYDAGGFSVIYIRVIKILSWNLCKTENVTVQTVCNDFNVGLFLDMKCIKKKWS